MEFALFRKIVDELVELNPDYRENKVVWLHGFGESLLHPEFDQCIEYAGMRGLYTGLSINPYMLDDMRSEKLIKSSPKIICLSLDGHDDDSFEKIRGVKNIYHISKNRLISFLEKKKKYHSKSRITLSMIDFDMNSESVNSTRDYWQSLEGIDEFLVKKFITWDGSCEEINAIAPEGDSASEKITCSFPFGSITILWNGNAVPCCFDYNGRYILGNMNTQTLADIWTGKLLADLRIQFIQNDVVNDLCRRCRKLWR